MNIIHVVIMSLVEGITEFLPVSSTFHLIFTAKLLGIPQTPFIKLFEVFIQSGAILSVLILYAQRLIKNKNLSIRVIVSFIPTALIGLVLYKLIKQLFEAEWVLVLVFMAVGILFIGVEYMLSKKKIHHKKSVEHMTYTEAIVVGLAQACAVIPGVSRAGSVILAMLVQGYSRTDAAEYSFMLSIPTIFAASLYDLYKMRDVLSAQGSAVSLLALGFVGAFISSFIIVRWFLTFIKEHSLSYFGWYRLALGIIILLSFMH